MWGQDPTTKKSVCATAEKPCSNLSSVFYFHKLMKKLKNKFLPIFFFLRLYLFNFRERGREGEKEGEKSMCGCLSHVLYQGPALQPSMCPDWESNQRPFGLQAGTQSTEPHQPEPFSVLAA